MPRCNHLHHVNHETFITYAPYQIVIYSDDKDHDDCMTLLGHMSKQRTNAKSERSKGRGLAICRRIIFRDDWCGITNARRKIGPILRTDFCAQGSYSSKDDVFDNYVTAKYLTVTLSDSNRYIRYFFLV